ncbi:SDR family oxidoreductase [Sphingopyxis sp.]|uniref:SDR family oxidoreductase n=1 Tax=Sphingopyxis sp. TaxID=1908224 RepID=UPI003D6CDFF6
MTDAFEPKHILITGCSSGIGRALVIEAARRGHRVTATARRPESLDDLPAARRLALDVTSDASVAEAVAAAGPVDVLINNAGVSLWGPVEAASSADVQGAFETNLFGALRVTRACLPAMRDRGSGAIFQVSSAAGKRSTAVLGHYAATKAALDAYSDALRIELRPFGIFVCSVLLGAVESAFPQNRQILPHPAYKAIIDGAMARVASNRTAPHSAASVAERIVDAIETGEPPLRLDGTGDAFALVRQRAEQDDVSWEEATLAGLLGSDWPKRTA